MLSITVYDDYCNNPPGMSVHGRSTWQPGKALDLYLQTHCGLKPADIEQRVERLCQAVVEVSPEVVRASRMFKNFELVGPRMLHAWNDGLNSLRLRKTWSLPTLQPLLQAEGLDEVAKPREPPKEKTGRSPLQLMS